jgi:Flp pilus assembly protein TadG
VRRRCRGDGGNALLEFTFLAVVLMLPLLWFVLAIFQVERNVYGVTEAAREAGRAFATTPGTDVEAARRRAEVAATLAVGGLGLDPDAARVSYLPAGGRCGRDGEIAPSLAPGSAFTVCVRHTLRFPGVPGILDGGNNTAYGQFRVQVDRYRPG